MSYGKWPCKGCKTIFPTEWEMNRHVSRNWPRCGSLAESLMNKVTKVKATSTWEHGKLKVTLTRKYDGRTELSTVEIINKDGETQGEHGGFMWKGSLEEFRAHRDSLVLLFGEVNTEVHGPYAAEPSTSAGCDCPKQHDLTCDGHG